VSRSAIRFFSSRLRRSITSAQFSSAVDVCQTIAFVRLPEAPPGPVFTNRKTGTTGSVGGRGGPMPYIAQSIAAHATTPSSTSGDPKSRSFDGGAVGITEPP